MRARGITHKVLRNTDSHRIFSAAFSFCRLLLFAWALLLMNPGAGFAQISGASLLSPVNGSTTPDGQVTLSWSTAPSAVSYYIYLGATPGNRDVYNSGEVTFTSVSLNLARGTTFYLRLWTHFASGWIYTDYSFMTGTGSAHLLYPQNGATNVRADTEFYWQAIPDALGYRLLIRLYYGGTYYLFDSGETTAINVSVPPMLPGTKYFTILATKKLGGWSSVYSNFVVGGADPGISTMVYPANGQTAVTSPLALSWTTVNGAQAYKVTVGTALGARDLYASAELSVASASYPSRVQPGTYYVRLYTKINGAWQYNDSIFTAGQQASLIAPLDHDPAFNPLTQFHWFSYSGATSYYLTVGSSPGARDVYSSGPTTSTALSVPNLQTGSTYYARLYTNINGNWNYSDSQFTVGLPLAVLSNPADHAINVAPFSPFVWNSVPGASAYMLWVGTAPGLQDVYSSGALSTTSTYVSALVNRNTYYARLFTLGPDGIWRYTDSSFQAGSGLATILYPPDKAVDVSPYNNFSWTSVPQAQAYYLYVGTCPGCKDVYDSFETLDTSRAVTNLTPNAKYYIRLYTKLGGVWRYLDTTFTAGIGIAHLLTPANGTSSFDPNDLFTWSSVPNTTKYYLRVGTAQGLGNILDSGELLQTWIFVPGLVQGQLYYARLYTLIGTQWLYTDSTFLASDGAVHFVHPANGDVNVDLFQPFSWESISYGVYGYDLYVGTSPGARDVFDSGFQALNPMRVPGLVPETTYYARLWVYRTSGWKYSDISFTTGKLSSLASQSPILFYDSIRSLTSTVRGMAATATNIPFAGTPLFYQVSFYKQTKYASCDDFAAVLANLLFDNSIPARVRTITLDGTLTEAHTMVEYYDPFAQKWSIADPTFGLLYFSKTTGAGLSVEEINSLLENNSYSSIDPQFVTSMQSFWMTTYYLDPITLYWNYYSPGGLSTSLDNLHNNFPTTNDPLQFLNEQELSAVMSQKGVYLFLFAEPGDSATIQTQSGVITVQPLNNTLWGGAVDFRYDSTWTVISAPTGMRVFTPQRVLF